MFAHLHLSTLMTTARFMEYSHSWYTLAMTMNLPLLNYCLESNLTTALGSTFCNAYSRLSIAIN